MIKNNQPENLNRALLEKIIFKVKKLVPIMTSLIFSVSPILKNPLTSHLASIKLLAIFVITNKSVYWNNNNYIPLFVAIYIYSASTKVNTITFFNRLDFFVLYNVLLRKLRNVNIFSVAL